MPFRTSMDLPEEAGVWFVSEASGKGMVSLDKSVLAIKGQIDDILLAAGADPEKLVARGGFGREQDLRLILEYGWDYEEGDTIMKPRNGTYVTPWNECDFIHRFEDPAHSPFFWVLQQIDDYPAMVFYHADKMTPASGYREKKGKVQYFSDPEKKLEALAGVIEFNIVR